MNATVAAPAATETPAQMIAEAARILGEVDAAGWPVSDEAQWAIDWACTDARRAAEDYGRLLSGDVHFSDTGAPDMEFWDHPERQALEYLADQALQAAVAAGKRLGEYQQREEMAAKSGSKGGER